MKKSLYLLLLFALALFNTGCRHTVAYPTVLSEADSLCMTAPTEAVALLDSIAPQMQQSSDAVRHYYDLLTVKARDKAFLPHTSDSLILDVLHYYEANNDRVNLPEAYYYAGRVTSDMGDAPQALEYYQKALESFACLKQDDQNMRLLSCIYAQKGWVLRNQHLWDYSVESFVEGLKIDSIQKDTLDMIYDLLDIGKVYHIQKNFCVSIQYFNRAEHLAKEAKMPLLEIDANKYKLSSYISDNRVTEISQIIAERGDQLKMLHDEDSKSIIACSYWKLGLRDSAAYYFRTLIEESNISMPNRLQGLIWLADDAVRKSLPGDAIEYIKQFIQVRNEVDLHLASETVAIANASYNYQTRERQNVRLKEQKARLTYIITILVLVFIFTSLSALYLYRKRRKENAIQYERLQYIISKQQKENESYIYSKRMEIQLLEQQLLGTQKENDNLKEQIEQMHRLTDKAEVICEINRVFLEKVQKSSIYDILVKKASDKMKMASSDFSQLEEMIESINPKFIDRLHYLYSFSPIEWQVSLLIKVGIPQHSIAVLLCRSDEGITSVRRRLVKKVLQRTGNAKEWDLFLENL